MCGRFSQRYTWREICDLYGLTGAARNLQPHYNIAPTDPVGVVRPSEAGATELVSMRWSPSGSRPLAGGAIGRKGLSFLRRLLRLFRLYLRQRRQDHRSIGRVEGRNRLGKTV